jgi:hypothetical protein
VNPVEVTDDYVIETMYRRWGITPKKIGHEWHSPCVQCGGTDRLMIFKNGGMYCRQCEYKGWLNDDGKNWKPDPLLMIQQAERVKLEREQREQRWRDWCNGFAAGYFWREWHDHMTEANRQWWQKQGVHKQLQDYYELGYIAEKKIKTKEDKSESDFTILPAYTIPVRDRDTWDLTGVHYRLVDPPEYVGGKYRYQEGVPAREFYAVPGVKDKAIVVEGAKKAMVVYDRLDADYQVIGLPGCTPSEEVMNRVKECGEVWLALDPGCMKQEQRFKRIVPQAKIMRMPTKPDDFFLGGGTTSQFKSYMAQGR